MTEYHLDTNYASGLLIRVDETKGIIGGQSVIKIRKCLTTNGFYYPSRLHRLEKCPKKLAKKH